MFNPSKTRQAFYDLFDKLLKFKPTNYGKTRSTNKEGELETNISEEYKKLPIELNSMVKDTTPHYFHRLTIDIDFSNFAQYAGSKRGDLPTEIEEELKILLQGYFEHKQDEWRDSP